MARFDKGKSIYPDELQAAGEVVGLVLGPSFKSKYPNKKTHRPVYSVKMDIEGESEEKYLNFNAESQAKGFDQYDGQKVKVQFDGTKVQITPLGGGPAMPSTGKPLTMEDVDGIRVRYQNLQFYGASAMLEVSAALDKHLKIKSTDENFGGMVSMLTRAIERHGGVMAFPDDRFIWEEKEAPEPAES